MITLQGATGRRFVVAATAARLAPEGLPLALVLLVRERTGGLADAGVLTACVTLPQFVLGPLGGARLDRTSRPWPALTTASLVAALAVTGLAMTAGRAPLAVPAALAVALSATEPLLTGGLSATAAATLDSSRPGRVQALDSLAYNVAGLAAPAAVAVLAGVVGPEVALAALAGGCVVAAGATVGLASLIDRGATGRRDAGTAGGDASTDDRWPAGTGALDGDHSDRTDHGRAGHERNGPESNGPGRNGREPPAGAVPLRQAAAALVRVPPLRATTAATTVAHCAIGAVPFAAVAAAAAHGLDADRGGHLVTAIAVGALAGSVAMTRLPLPRSAERLVLASLAAMGVVAVAAGGLGWAGVLVAAAVFGVWDGPLLVGTYAVRAGHGPPGAVASVFTVAASLKLGAASIGALAGGYLLDGRATAAGLVAIGVAHLAAAAVGLALCRPPGRRG